MEPTTLSARLDRLASLRGDPVQGLPESTWAENLDGVDPDLLLRAAIKAVRELLIPGWASGRPDDLRPQQALAAAEAWMASRSQESVLHARATAKACTAARNERYGFEHRVPQAARAVAAVCGAKDGKRVFEAIASVEEELLARLMLTAEYERVPEVRRAVVGVLREVLLPPAPVAEAAVVEAPAPVDTTPVPYSPSGNFVVGQTLIHKKFGNVSVVHVDPTMIEVSLPDGTKSRLVHRR